MSDWAEEPWHVSSHEPTTIVAISSVGVARACDAWTRGEADAKRIVECVNGCANITDPETTVPELVAVAKRACGICVCHTTVRPDISCLSCAARAVLAKTKGRER